MATAMVVPVFAGIGAVTSQLAATRRAALGLATGSLALSWILRVFSDTVGGLGWLRWATPLGWAEELRPFTAPQPLVLLLPVAATVTLLSVAVHVSKSRDVGIGLMHIADSALRPTRLLRSPTIHALYSQRSTLTLWAIGTTGFGAILGAISTSVSSAGISQNVQKRLQKFGTGSIASPIGYLSFVFIVFIFAICLFVCSQVGAAREEEVKQRLETVFAQPFSRLRWLAGRLVIAVASTGILGLLSGLLTWAGANAQGVRVSLPSMLEAGANCVPVSVLFLGISALVFSVTPRATTVISYTLVASSFLWYMVGGVAGAPTWVVGISPFRHIGLVPAQDFQALAAVVMVSIGLLTASISVYAFKRRDLVSA